MIEALRIALPALLVALVFFGIFGLLGLHKPNWPLWRAVDMLYYPLIALGAIMLLISEADRSSGKLIESAEITYRDTLETLQKFPPVHFLIDGSKTERELLGLLEWPISISETCAKDNFSLQLCSAAQAWFPLFQSQVVFLEEKYDSNSLFVADVCEGFLRAVTITLPKTNLMIRGELKEFVLTGLSKQFRIEQFEQTMQLANNFENQAKNRKRKYLSSFSTDDREIYLQFLEKEIVFASTFLSAHEFCFRLPAQLNNKEIEHWRQRRAEETSEAEARKNATLRIARAQKKLADDIASLRSESWIFVLLVALALKFGKGCASRKKSL